MTLRTSVTPAGSTIPRLTGALANLPDGLYQATGRLLNEMAALTRPEPKGPVAALMAAKEAASKVDERWQQLQRMASRALGNGSKHGVSVSEFRAAMWAHPSYGVYNRVWQVFRQSTPEYRDWKKSYDAQRYKLKKLGLWERWQAEQAYSDAWEATCEAYALKDVFGGCPVGC